MLEQRLELRAEEQRVAELGVVERLLPEPVAREERARCRGSSQSANANMPFSRSTQRGAALLVEVDDHLGVGVRREAVAARLELRAQLAEVVDLAVEDDAAPMPSSFAIGWSPASRSMIESRRKPRPTATPSSYSATWKPSSSGPAVLEHAGHPREHVAVDRVAVRRSRRFRTSRERPATRPGVAPRSCAARERGRRASPATRGTCARSAPRAGRAGSG